MATYKYLDSTGLGQVWEKIKTLVSNSIPTPDWNESDNTSANYIANKPPIKTGTGTNSIIIGDSDNIASGICSIANGYQNISSNKYSIAFGEASKASGQDSVAIGAFLNLGTITLTGSASSLTYTDTATSQSTIDLLKRYGQSLFVWVNNKPIRLTSITSNENLLITFTFESTLSEEAIIAVDYTLYAANIATGVGAMAFGHANRASGQNAFVFGTSNASTGTASFVEGKANEASNNQSHAEGFGTKSLGKQSHSEGRYTIAAGERSHAQGEYTTANGYVETTIGRYNALSNSTAQTSYNVTNSPYILVAGNGTADNARSNAYTLDWSGNGWYAGKLTVGATPTNTMDVATKGYVDTATASITDEKLSTGTIGNNVYYPIVGDNTASATTKYIDSTGLKYDATSSTNGYARLYLGNGTASGTEGSKYGRLMIYGTTAYAVTLDSGSPTENRSISLPNKNGTVALTSDVPTKTSDLTNDSGFLTSHQSLANYVTLNGNQTITGAKTFSSEVTFSASGASDISNLILCAFKVNRGQITNFFTQNIYTKTNDITFYKYSDIVNSAPSSPTALFTIKNGGTVSVGTTSDIPSITADNELTTKKYVDDAIAGAGTGSGAGTLSISANVITLTGSDGTTSSVTLPVYNGGVSS